MSYLVGAALPVAILRREETWEPQRRYLSIGSLEVVGLMGWDYGFTTPWWPDGGTAGFIGTMGIDGQTLVSWQMWDLQRGGSRTSFAISGVTRDAYGSPVPGCTVKLFQTSTDTVVYTTTSDPVSGVFTVYTPYYPDTHYLTAYKVGSPDTEGTTVNTLVGS